MDAETTLAAYTLEYLLHRRTWPTEWPLYLVLAVAEYVLQTGDLAFAERHWKELLARLPLGWLDASTGLLRKDFGCDGSHSVTDHDIVDWPPAERDGYVFAPVNTVVNAAGYAAFEAMARLEDLTGQPESARRLRAIARRLRRSLNAYVLDRPASAYRDGLHADGAPVDHDALHASVFPLAFGMAPAGVRRRVARHILGRGMACSPFAAPFLVEALFSGGYGAEALALVTAPGPRSWRHMLELGAGSTTEAWDQLFKPNLNHSHPWSASPTFLVAELVAGIRPLTPGFAWFSVTPQPAGLDRFRVVRPTVRGPITVAWDDEDGGRLDVVVPEGTTATVAVPGHAPREVGPGHHLLRDRRASGRLDDPSSTRFLPLPSPSPTSAARPSATHGPGS